MRYGDIPPNQTLYLNNLNEKIKVDELKCCIHELFSTYGEVIDIVASGSLKKKGQSFVVFRDISCATNALRALQGFVFLDKAVRIAYAKTKSDVVAHDDGSYKPRAKAGAADEKKDVKKGPGAPRGTSKGAPGKGKDSRQEAPRPTSKPAASGAGRTEGGNEQPSNVLFVENLPAEVNEMMLTMLFRQYPGFQEARLIKGRNVAFIEYGDELQAGIAKHGLQGFMVTPEMALKISFAKQ